MEILRKVKRRYFSPMVIRKIKSQGVMVPRESSFEENSVSQVFRIACGDNLDRAYKAIECIWDDNISKLFPPGSSVLIKINLNTQDPYPASTSPDMLDGLLGFLADKGIENIMVGDCSAVSALPTRKNAKSTGIERVVNGRARMMYFDKEAWVTAPIEGRYLDWVTVPRIAMEVDRIISLANLKTHRLADFSFGLKLGVGFMHPMERAAMHRENLREKAVEINLAVPPGLVIIDGRKAFITGGPIKGRVEDCGTVLVGTNPLSVDIEAYRTLYELKKIHGCLEGFGEDPFEMPQLLHARDIGLGGSKWNGYDVIEL